MRVVRALGVLAAAAALAACGMEDPVASEDVPDEEAADEESVDQEPDEADVGGDATLSTAETDLGEVIVDAEGYTLYLFDPDEQGASTCHDDCADNWPPLLDDAPVAGDGVDGDLLGTSERDDGEVQVTYDGWPLYRWIGDEEPGDTNGQGVGDVWWTLAADGTPQRADAAGDGAEDEDDSPTY